MFNWAINRRKKDPQKVFCIGLNKTGTTSIETAFHELGYTCGDPVEAKRLLSAWGRREFGEIVEFARTAEAFQDSPFSFPYTYQALHQAFPQSKFILTVRDDPEQWYRSLVNFHGKLWANGQVPQKSDLMNAVNVYKGRPWEVNRLLFDTPENDPYNKDALVRFYNWHKQCIENYFRHCSGRLLVLNVSEAGAYNRLSSFLGKPCPRQDFPWENKTS